LQRAPVIRIGYGPLHAIGRRGACPDGLIERDALNCADGGAEGIGPHDRAVQYALGQRTALQPNLEQGGVAQYRADMMLVERLCGVARKRP